MEKEAERKTRGRRRRGRGWRATQGHKQRKHNAWVDVQFHSAGWASNFREIMAPADDWLSRLSVSWGGWICGSVAPRLPGRRSSPDQIHTAVGPRSCSQSLSPAGACVSVVSPRAVCTDASCENVREFRPACCLTACREMSGKRRPVLGFLPACRLLLMLR